jgi:hypothetical protein
VVIVGAGKWTGMRVLGVLAAWGVLAVLATLCFAVGGSIGYRRGVQDAVRQLRERRSGKAGCRPVPLSHHRRRPIPRVGQRSTADPSRGVPSPAFAAYSSRLRQAADIHWSPALISAVVAVCVLVVPGVAIGATTAQPGERLWHVKRGLERTRLALTWGTDAEVAAHVDLAGRRLGELNQVLSTGRVDPQVVDSVIDGLRGHTEAATAGLKDVGQADRAALVERLDGLVDRQVAVIDVLIGVDCADRADQQCVALAGAGEASAELQRTTTAIALAENVPTDDAAGTSAGPTDTAVSSTVATASAEATAVAAPAEASESPTATATPGSESAASPSQTPSASASPPAPAGGGSAAAAASTAPATSSPGQSSPPSGKSKTSPPKTKTGPNRSDADDDPPTKTADPPLVDVPDLPSIGTDGGQ